MTDEGAPPLAIFERMSSLVEIARALYTHNAGAPSFAFLTKELLRWASDDEGAPALFMSPKELLRYIVGAPSFKN